jgi:hypothetical protein
MQRAAPRHPQRTLGTRADRGSAYLVESCGQSQLLAHRIAGTGESTIH